MRLDGFLATTDEDFEWAFDINFFTALRAMRAALAGMAERGSGAIVNVASVNSFYHPDSVVMDYGAFSPWRRASSAALTIASASARNAAREGSRV